MTGQLRHVDGQARDDKRCHLALTQLAVPWAVSSGLQTPYHLHWPLWPPTQLQWRGPPWGSSRRHHHCRWQRLDSWMSACQSLSHFQHQPPNSGHWVACSGVLAEMASEATRCGAGHGLCWEARQERGESCASAKRRPHHTRAARPRPRVNGGRPDT